MVPAVPFVKPVAPSPPFRAAIPASALILFSPTVAPASPCRVPREVKEFMAAPAVELGVEAATGLVRAPRALLVVERGFALVLVAEVWAAAAAAASVARFCNCKAFMPAIC